GELGRDFNRCAQASAFAALECAQLGNDQEAEDYLRAAYEYVNNVEDKQRPRAQAIVLARAADVAASKNDYEQALSLYSKSQDILQGGEGGTLDLIRLLRARADVYSRLKDYEKAHADLERAISEVESYRARIKESENRSYFFDAVQGTF